MALPSVYFSYDIVLTQVIADVGTHSHRYGSDRLRSCHVVNKPIIYPEHLKQLIFR